MIFFRQRNINRSDAYKGQNVESLEDCTNGAEPQQLLTVLKTMLFKVRNPIGQYAL